MSIAIATKTLTKKKKLIDRSPFCRSPIPFGKTKLWRAHLTPPTPVVMYPSDFRVRACTTALCVESQVLVWTTDFRFSVEREYNDVYFMVRRVTSKMSLVLDVVDEVSKSGSQLGVVQATILVLQLEARVQRQP